MKADKIKTQIKAVLTAGLYKKDGSRTSFAKKFGIKTYMDYEKYFKDMKKNFKNDRESQAFAMIIEFAKSAVGRFAKQLGDFGSFVFIIRTMGLILDDLRRLREVLNELEAKNVKEFLELKEMHTKLIPPSLKTMIRRPSYRAKMMEKCGPEAFLDPDNMKFPVMTDNCEYHCGLIIAAYLRARENAGRFEDKKDYYDKIAEMAYKLYEKQKCKDKVGVEIHKK